MQYIDTLAAYHKVVAEMECLIEGERDRQRTEG